MHEHLHPRPVKALRPSPGQRRTMYLVSALLLASGLLWLTAHYLLPLPEFAARHPLEPWAARIHGAAAMGGLAVLGSLWGSHALPAWQRARHRGTGAPLLGAWLLLVLTGYGLYYLADEDLRALFSLSHWIVGLSTPPALLLHVLQARRERR